MLTELKKKGKKLLIAVDETIVNDHVREFASIYQILMREDYPIFLIMTGLFENIYDLQNQEGLTFLSNPWREYSAFYKTGMNRLNF